MSDIKFNPPRRKRCYNVEKHAPFPIPIEVLPDSRHWTVFKGHLRGVSVIIEDEQHAKLISQMGYFGTENGSKRPRFESAEDTSAAPTVMPQRRYELRQKWKRKDQIFQFFKFDEPEVKENTVLVIPDCDDDVEPDDSEIDFEEKPDPYPMKRFLRLTLVEAFFLAFGLGCLEVYVENKKTLSLEELWRRFSEAESSFVPRYVAYHHFRSKGWVVKSGIKFGVDFILYKDGPHFYHSSYSVVVKLVDGSSLKDLGHTSPPRPLTWSSLAGLNRITEHVAKELLYCYVIQPPDVKREKLSLKVFKEFKVQEMLVRRWISNKERENELKELA